MDYALEATANNSFQQRRGGSGYQNNNNRSFQNQNPNYNRQQDGNYQPNRSYNNMNSPQQFDQQPFRNNQNNSRNFQQQRGGDDMGYSNNRGQPHQNDYNRNQNNQNYNRPNNFNANNNYNRPNDYNRSFNNGPYNDNQNNFGNNGRGGMGNMGNRNNWNSYDNNNQRYQTQSNSFNQNYDDISHQFEPEPQPYKNPYQINHQKSYTPPPADQINYPNQRNQDRNTGGYNNNSSYQRNDNNFNRGRGGGRGRGSYGGGNRFDGQRNQYQNYRGQQARYEPQRELSQAQLAQILRQKNNQALQTYPNFNFPHAATIENRNQIYIFSNDEKNKISNSQGGIASLKGPKKIDIPSNAGIKNFYEFPGLPNRGQLQRERVLGFKQSTGINFNDFQRRGMELMQQIVGSLESYK